MAGVSRTREPRCTLGSRIRYEGVTTLAARAGERFESVTPGQGARVAAPDCARHVDC